MGLSYGDKLFDIKVSNARTPTTIFSPPNTVCRVIFFWCYSHFASPAWHSFITHRQRRGVTEAEVGVQLVSPVDEWLVVKLCLLPINRDHIDPAIYVYMYVCISIIICCQMIGAVFMWWLWNSFQVKCWVTLGTSTLLLQNKPQINKRIIKVTSCMYMDIYIADIILIKLTVCRDKHGHQGTAVGC